MNQIFNFLKYFCFFCFLLFFSFPSFAQICNLNLDYQIQSNDQIVLLCNEGYEVGYNNNKKIPEFVAFIGINQNQCMKRGNNQFITDNRVKVGSRSLSSNYNNSGFDRGHMVSDEDMCANEKLRNDTYLMSNVVPQIPNFNRGIWNKIDNYLQNEYRKTPSLILKGTDGEIGKLNGISIPKYFWAILINDNQQIGFWIPHESNLKNIHNYQISVNEILKKKQLSIKGKN